MKWNFRRSHSALLVIDMQNDFVQPGAIMEVPQAKEQVPNIARLIAACRRLGVPVIYTVHETDPARCPLEIAAFPHLKEAGMRRGTPGVEVVDELAPAPGETVIRKHRFSGFYQTELELVLRSMPVDTLIICGTVTNICCEATARDAFYRDYKVVFGSDICSALNPQAHNATLTNMEIFGRVMNCEEILAALERKYRPEVYELIDRIESGEEKLIGYPSMEAFWADMHAEDDDE